MRRFWQCLCHVATCLAAMSCTAGMVFADDVEIVARKQSAYVIHHASEASETTKWAAGELRRVIGRATGVELPITAMTPTGRAIRLVADPDLPPDGFEIRLKDGDVLIVGNDTQSPAKPELWFVPSHGVLYGALEFLERFADARWLFPGELGEDVPERETLRVSLDRPVRGSPTFAVRSLAYVGESDRGTPGRPKSAVLDWMKRQRLTNAIHPFVAGYGHAWDDYLVPADLAAHPEWKPTGESVRRGKVTFFCTTAPGVVELFAARVIESLDRHPTRPMASISPTDGGGFCTCERCSKLLDDDPHGRRSHARLILTFYQRVAEIVQRERPGRRLGGFVYYNYQYPPQQVLALPDNLSLCWAPLNYYGYGLLKPVYRDEFAGTMERWSRFTPHLFYHNYSTWMRSFHGAPLPPSVEILERELPTAAKHRAWGARMVGSTAWGVNGPLNTLLARQMWDAELNVSATLDDWLRRAYGPGWRHLRTVYDELDVRMRAHKEKQSPVYKGSQYEVNEEVLATLYAPLFPELERAYLSVRAACVTDRQRQRLALFCDNLTHLHFALRQAGLLADTPRSIFHRDEAEFAKFLEGMESTVSLYRDDTGLYRGPIWKGEWRGR